MSYSDSQIRAYMLKKFSEHTEEGSSRANARTLSIMDAVERFRIAERSARDILDLARVNREIAA